MHTNADVHKIKAKLANEEISNDAFKVLILISEFEHHSNELIWRELSHKYKFIKLVKLKFNNNSSNINIKELES